MMGSTKYEILTFIYIFALPTLSAHVPHQVLAVAPGADPEANAGTRLNALLPRTPLQAGVSNAVQKKDEGAASSGGTRADADAAEVIQCDAQLTNQHNIRLLGRVLIKFSILRAGEGVFARSLPFLDHVGN